MLVNKSRPLSFDLGANAPCEPTVPRGYYGYYTGEAGCFNYPKGTDSARLFHFNKLYGATRYFAPPTYIGGETFQSTKRKKRDGAENRPYNNCSHVIHKGFNYPYFWLETCKGAPCDNIPYDKKYGYYTYGALRQMMPTFNAVKVEKTKDTRPTCFDQLPNAQRNAWHAMQPRFEGRISLINALFELKDFRDVLGVFSSLKPWRIAPLLRKAARKRLLKKPDLDPSVPIAQLFLTDQLALQPLLRDISEIVTQIHDLVVVKQYEFGLAGESLQKSHYSVTLCDQSEVGSVSNFFLTPIVKGIKDVTTFNATMEYQYTYKTRPLLDAFIKYWGLGISYEALWNAVPWSFVADYFTGISASIHNMTHDQNVNLCLTQYCESILREHIFGTFASGFGDGAYGAENPTNLFVNGAGLGVIPSLTNLVPLTGYGGSTYNRRVCIPNKGVALPILKLPNNRQWLNMAALARCFF
jgi:hypothetical protein